MTVRKKCVICEKTITEQFHVCMNCLKTYNIPYEYRNWPLWVKALVNIELKNLKLLREEEKHMTSPEGVREETVLRRF